MIALRCIEPYKVEKLGGLHADFRKNWLYFAECEDEYGHYHFKNMGLYAFSVENSYFERLSLDEAKFALLLFDSEPQKA